jgi:hypothetical protein
MTANTIPPKVNVQILETQKGEFAILEVIYFTRNHQTLGTINQYKTKREYDVYDESDDHVGTFPSIDAALKEIGYKS